MSVTSKSSNSTNSFRFMHYLRENKSTETPTRFIAVDTETLTEKDALGTQKQVLRLGVAIWFTLPNNAKKSAQRQDWLFYDADDFWDFVEKHLEKKSRTVITGHNIAFDLLVLDAMQQLKRRGWQLNYPIATGFRFIAQAKRGSTTLLFLDSMNYIPTSLADLGKSLRLEKTKMPAVVADDAEWFRYCVRDAEIVERFWRELVEFSRQNDFGVLGKTAASYALNAYRHRFMSEPILIHDKQEILELERRAYRGGRCECFFLGKLPEQDYYVLDVNSLYPSVMRDNFFPTALAGHKNCVGDVDLDRLMDSYYCIATVGLDTDVNCYPLVMNKRLCFPVGRFETTLSSPELGHALAYGHVRYVSQVAYYQQSKLFKGYVDTLYQRRREYAESRNLAFELFCKMLLNSLYGKFGQRGHIRVKMPHDGLVDYGYERCFCSDLNCFADITYWDGVGYLDYEDGESFNSFPAIAAAVTAYGRMRLWKLIQAAGFKNTFYVDTDSLLVNRDGYRNLLSHRDETALGALKLVAQPRKVTLRGAKDYTMDDTTRIKGVPKNSIRISENEFETERFLTFFQNIRKGNTSGVLQERQRKALKRIYDKGVVGADGVVMPFSLSDF